MARKQTDGAVRGGLGLWFALTAQERFFLAVVLTIFLVGLAARYAYLRSQEASSHTPPGLERFEPGRALSR